MIYETGKDADHTALVWHIAKRYGGDVGEHFSAGLLGLAKAHAGYDPEKGVAFSVFAWTCVENEIRMAMRRDRKREGDVSLCDVSRDTHGLEVGATLGTGPDVVSERIERAAELEMLRQAMRGLSDRDRLIIRARYGLDDGKAMTQAEAARMVGITQAALSRAERRILGRLREAMEGMYAPREKICKTP